LDFERDITLDEFPTLGGSCHWLKDALANRLWASQKHLCMGACSRARQDICGNSFRTTTTDPEYTGGMRLNDQLHTRTRVEYDPRG
jgi:hypothetical protein